MTFSYICLPAFFIVYARIRKLHSQTWDGWSWESLKEWWPFLKLGIPGVAMTCLEWISYEIAAFVLGSISEVELAANSIIINVLMILFMIPLGISIASGVRVGNELGAGNPQQAKRATIVAVSATVLNVIFQCVLLQSTKSVIGYIYTQDSEVIERIPDLLNVITVLIIGDQIQLSLRGVILGCGHQLFGAILNFISFYIVGLPLGITLALKTTLSSVGMWIGLLCACYIQTTCSVIYVLRLNWEKQSKKAIIRAQGTEKKTEESQQEISENETISDEIQMRRITNDTNEDHDLQLIEIELHKEEHIMHSEIEMEDLNELVTDEVDGQDEETLLPVEITEKKSSRRLHMQLFLTKLSLFLIVSIMVVIAGVISQFHPPDSIFNGNYSECLADIDYIEPSSTYIVYPTLLPLD
jgi:MATE family multidrug resistance protein